MKLDLQALLAMAQGGHERAGGLDSVRASVDMLAIDSVEAPAPD
jgi:hypothetical protein